MAHAGTEGVSGSAGVACGSGRHPRGRWHCMRVAGVARRWPTPAEATDDRFCDRPGTPAGHPPAERPQSKPASSPQCHKSP